MNRRGGPPSQLPTLTEVVGDAAPPPGFVTSTAGARLVDEVLRDDSSAIDPGKDQVTPVSVAAEVRAAARLGADRRVDPPASHVDNALASAPPTRQALTRKPRSPLGSPPSGAAGSQLPLLAVPFDAVPASGDAPVMSATIEPGLGADIFERAGPAPGDSGDDQLVRTVLHDLQRHVDMMLEYRLRASLTPLLTQMADNLVRELRQELAGTLRDVVKRAVNQELVRRRKR